MAAKKGIRTPTTKIGTTPGGRAYSSFEHGGATHTRVFDTDKLGRRVTFVKTSGVQTKDGSGVLREKFTRNPSSNKLIKATSFKKGPTKPVKKK